MHEGVEGFMVRLGYDFGGGKSSAEFSKVSRVSRVSRAQQHTLHPF